MSEGSMQFSRKGLNPMPRKRGSSLDKAAVLRKRVTIIEEFEPNKLDEVPDKKGIWIMLSAFLKRLGFLFGIESIRSLF